MKKIKILLLNLFLTCVCSADMTDLPNSPVFPIWIYVPSENAEKTTSNPLVPSKNVTKIELVKIVVEGNAIGGGAIIYYAPDSLQRNLVLKKEMNKYFLNDINRLALVTERRELFICCDVNLYERENVIATFKTDGHYFYDEEKRLLYEYHYIGKAMSYEDLISKYWKIEPGYGRYIWVK